MSPATRRALFLAAGLAVLATLGWSVRDFEALMASGEVVLLDLAPAIHLDAPAGTIILGLDEQRVGRFRRLGSTGAPGEGETAFRVRRAASGDGVTVEPHSFLFQEGQADLYAKAKYGLFRVDASGRHLLVGLADADARKIEPH
ncbi:GDYXXLXY domain-containing protein [Xanthobacter autotrophicus]|uniref:GDYXXLXY domain-containing protein n=1 Tax=Xanthobacter autotrophicus TaxID=280 RepID=UPI0024A6B959|nr:GDYXXLXY domain-containing protein [Xanthobacter autotrophicus]MDI4655224.1 hypothetical protein [Xanthobacter autotrophicus]